jgi:hypothetical protein
MGLLIGVVVFCFKAYLVLLVLSAVFGVVGMAIKGVHELLGIDPYGNMWLSLTVTWVIMGGFLYLVGHLIAGFLTPVSGH